MKITFGICLLSASIATHATEQLQSKPMTSEHANIGVQVMRMAILKQMENLCTLPILEEKSSDAATSECKIAFMAKTSKCLGEVVCEPIDSEIRQYIEEIRPSGDTVEKRPVNK